MPRIFMTPKQKATSLGFKKNSQVIFNDKTYTIVHHGGGSVINPRVYITDNKGVFIYKSIKSLILVNKESQKFKVGDKVKYKFKDYGHLQYGEGIIISSCHNRLFVEGRMIVMSEKHEFLCIPVKDLELKDQESKNGDCANYPQKIFRSRFIPGDIIEYEDEVLYVVSFFKCLLTGSNFLLLSNGNYCLDSSVKMIDKCVYQS